MSFDGSEYRREVLIPLRDRSPGEVEDLFWLALVPRELDDDAEVAARLQAARGFLFKERTRARQAAVAQAVLKEWPRIEATLLDRAARGALRRRLGEAPAAAAAAPAPAKRAGGDRRRQQVVAGLAELARLREDPELGADLFAFLGLPVSAPQSMVAERIERVAEVNRRRRPDRERALVDDLLAHARRLLVQGEPAAYLASLTQAVRDAAIEALLASGSVSAGTSGAAGSVPAGTSRAAEAVAAARTAGVTDAELVHALAPAATQAALLPLSPHGLGTWCPACGTIAASGAAACPACSAPLTLTCPNGHTAPADAPDCPACHAPLEAERAALGARRAELEAERLAAAAPPRGGVVEVDGEEAELRWEHPPAGPPDSYLVERHPAARVLGRTSLTQWTDRAEPGVWWTVRALRGGLSSEPLELRQGVRQQAPTKAVTSSQPPRVRNLVATPTKPVTLTWEADGEPTLTRTHDDIVRTLEPNRDDGHVDKQVAFGTTYRYDLVLDGETATVTVTPEPAVTHLRITEGPKAEWTWPPGVTEAYLAFGPEPPADTTAEGRKITNTRYEIDRGVPLPGILPGMHLAVFAGRRDAAGTLTWSTHAARTRA